MNPSSHSTRPLAAAATAALFAGIWAVLQWPWVRNIDDARGNQAGAWLLIAYFLALAVILLVRPRAGRWLTLGTGALLLAFILLALPAAVGVAQFSCQGAGWRCYVEGLAVVGTGAALVVLCFRPFTPPAPRSAA